MASYPYTGTLTDYGEAPFPGALPQLYVEPDQPGYGDGTILADRRIPVTVASDGSFSVELAASSAVAPADPSRGAEVRYSLVCEWLDTAGVPRGWSTWARFRAAVGGGSIAELADAPAPPWSITYGYGPPPPSASGLYIDISGVNPVLYAPEGGGV